MEENDEVVEVVLRLRMFGTQEQRDKTVRRICRILAVKGFKLCGLVHWQRYDPRSMARGGGYAADAMQAPASDLMADE